MISKDTFQQWLPVVLVWLCLVLLPVGRMVELPVAIMALMGLWAFVRGGWRDCRSGPRGFFTLVMLLLWIPQVASVVDAVNFSRTFGGVLSFTRFYFSGLYIIASFGSPLAFGRLGRLFSIVLLFWVSDALLQAVVGFDVFGFAQHPGRINGVFGPKLKLGPFLTIFSPVLFHYARSKYNLAVQAAVFLATCAVLLLAGSRSSWVMLFFIVVGYFLYLCFESKRLKWQHVFGMAVSGVLLMVLCGLIYPPFQDKVHQTALLFKGDRQSVDEALSARLGIWDIAIRMIKDHPINGVGVRGFRYVYPEYAAPDDMFMQFSGGETGATHAHLLALEILSETGVIGLLGYLGVLVLAVRRWFSIDSRQKAVLLPFALATMACLLPINTHMAFYSASLAQVIFLFVALYCCEIPEPVPNNHAVSG